MAEPIKIIMKDETGSQSFSAGGNIDSKKQAALSTEQVKANEKQSSIAAAGVYVAMGTANYVTSNIGKYTGNKQLQANIDNAKKVAGYGTAFAANFWLGLAVIAVDGATSVANYNFERHWDEIRSSQAKARNGDLGGYRR